MKKENKIDKRDDNIYVKMSNGRYRAYGQKYDEPYLYDGIWYVRHNPGSTQTTSVKYMEGIYRVGDRPQKIDVLKLCAMEDYKDYILQSKEFKEMIDSGYYNWNDLVAKTISLVLDLNERYKTDDNSSRF